MRGGILQSRLKILAKTSCSAAHAALRWCICRGTTLALLQPRESWFQGANMEAKAKLFGHSIHQMLIVFPLGLLGMGVVFDVVYLSTHDEVFTAVAYWMMVAGIAGGLVAAPFGLIDWLAIPSGTRAKAVGGAHG